jgi:galactonate dehydratase
MAEAFDVAVAPHCPLGPIAFAACLQLDFCTHNAFIQESHLRLHEGKEADGLKYLKDIAPYIMQDGYLLRTGKPGLGIEVDENYVREQAKTPHHWRTPQWRNEDGGVSEW